MFIRRALSPPFPPGLAIQTYPSFDDIRAHRPRTGAMLPSCNFKSLVLYVFATNSMMLAPVLLRIGNRVSSPLAAYVCLKSRTRDTKPCPSPKTPRATRLPRLRSRPFLPTVSFP